MNPTFTTNDGEMPERSSLAYGKLAVVTVDLQPKLWRDAAWASKNVIDPYADVTPEYWHHVDAKSASSVERMQALISNNLAAIRWAYKHNVAHYLVVLEGQGPVHPLLRESLRADKTTLVRKAANSVFAVPAFKNNLRQCKVETLIYGGIHSWACVGDSLRAGLDGGYNAVVPSDMHANVASEVRFEKPKTGDGFVEIPVGRSKPEAGICHRQDMTLVQWLGLIDAANKSEAAWQKAVQQWSVCSSKPRRAEAMTLA